MKNLHLLHIGTHHTYFTQTSGTDIDVMWHTSEDIPEYIFSDHILQVVEF